MEVETTKQQTIELLSAQLGKPISEPAFRCWRTAIGIGPKARYTRFDVFRLHFVGDYLNCDRNLRRAIASLKRTLAEMKEKKTDGV